MNYENPDSMSKEETGAPATNPDTAQKPNLDMYLSTVNIATELDEEVLKKMGEEVHRGYIQDKQSKEKWDSQVDEYIKLATQITEAKTYPWPKAANIKYPLLSTAALQFQARAYPSLIPADGKVVQMKVVGMDPQGEKANKANRLAAHMNYQLLKDMKDWEEEMDRLLMQLPIVGCLFKKTYFDGIQKVNASKLLGPRDLVVNYWATSLEAAYRKTEVIPMTANDIASYKTAKLFLDVELTQPSNEPELPKKIDVAGAQTLSQTPPQADATTPYVILEQHTFWDLDNDGYAEPYIITIEESSKSVLRVVARWDSDGVVTNDEGDIVYIDPVEYYTKYSFIPNPDGGFYDIGFGHLLGPLNDSANTIINQLIDAGSLSILQSGFIGKGLRLKIGEQRFQPGEWKTVNFTGDDIKKNIFPLPTKEPSEVLFKLLGLVIESTKELASVAEIFVGKMPGQNTPATTTMASIEQGMKVFTAIYKRIYRALSKEYKKLFRLNNLHPENTAKAQLILDEPISQIDYDQKNYDVCPTADPTAVSSTQKLLKAQGLMEILPLGTIDPLEVTKRILEAQEQPNIEALFRQGPPPPDPEQQKMQMEGQMKQEEHQMKMAMEQFKLQMKQQEAMMDQKFMQMEKMMEMRLKEMEFSQKAEHQMRQSQIDQVTGAQQLHHNQAQHDQKMTQMKEQNAQRRVAGVEGKQSNKGTSKPTNSKA